MRDEGWQAALDRQAEDVREWAARQPAPWWVRFHTPARGIFAEGDDHHVMTRTLFAMRLPVCPAPTDREGVTYYPLDDVEYLVADEADMHAVMRCVRLTGLHGTYRKAGTDKEYRF